MKFKLPIIALAVAALLSGCASEHKNQVTPVAAKGTNFLGIVKIEPESFAVSEPTTDVIKTSELSNRRNFSGNRTSLFWGVFTIEDY